MVYDPIILESDLLICYWGIFLLHQWYWHIIYLFIQWYLCLVLVSGWCWPPRMCWEAFLPLKLFCNSLRKLSVNSSSAGRIYQWSHLFLDFCLLIVYFITDSSSLLVIGLNILSISSWFSFRRLNFAKIFSIPYRLSILLVYNCY